MHTAHGVGHAVAGGTGGHVVRMQGAARAAAGGDGEVLLALLDALFLIGAGDGMLEAGRVGGVAGDGNVHALGVHDGHALAHVVRAVAAHVRALALAVADLTHDVQLAGEVVELGLNVGEAVDAADDLSSVLAETVEDDAQRLLAGLVGVLDDADGTLCGGEGLVTGEEGKALRLVGEQHRAEVAVTETDLAVLGDGAIDAEGLEADADHLGGLGGRFYARLERDGRAHGVRPAGVFKADGLDALDDLVGIKALGLAELAALLHGGDAILREDAVDLVDSSLVIFKQSHCFVLPSLFLTRVDVLRRAVPLTVMALGLFERGVGVVALLDEVHHLAEVDELIADDLVLRVERHSGAVALGHFEVARTLGDGAEHRADLAAQTLAEVLEGRADGETVLGEGGLGAAVDDLEEQLAHGGVDGIAHEVGVERLKNGLADEDLGRHRGGVGHAGAADGLDQRLLNDALLDVERQLARALLWSAPADAVGKAGNVGELLGLHPLALFGDGSGTVICALGDRAHMLNFGRVNHGDLPFL